MLVAREMAGEVVPGEAGEVVGDRENAGDEREKGERGGFGRWRGALGGTVQRETEGVWPPARCLRRGFLGGREKPAGVLEGKSGVGGGGFGGGREQFR